MLKRTITGAFITFFVYLAIYFSHIPAVIYTFTALLCGFSVYEICRAITSYDEKSCFWFAALFALMAVAAEPQHITEIISIALIITTALMLYLMIRMIHCSFIIFSAVMISILITTMFKAIPELRALENGVWYLTYGFTLCFVCDIFAYLIGRFFGKHKLLPAISPNKTIEGSVAGTLCTVLIAVLGGFLLEYFNILHIDYRMLGVYALCAAIIGQFGDLSMSVIKRICKIKDFSNLFPGHGGVLDRFDSHLFVVAFTYMFCIITDGFLY